MDTGGCWAGAGASPAEAEAGVALSPWPTSPVALQAAIEQLSVAIGASAEIAARLGPVASELVEDYAAGARQAIKNEAVIRCSGWLHGARPRGLTSMKTGPIDFEFASTAASALRASGAMALLSRWKVRRAGVIK